MTRFIFHSNNKTKRFYHRVIPPNDSEGLQTVKTDQTAPERAVWSGSALVDKPYNNEEPKFAAFFLLQFCENILPEDW